MELLLGLNSLPHGPFWDGSLLNQSMPDDEAIGIECEQEEKPHTSQVMLEMTPHHLAIFCQLKVRN